MYDRLSIVHDINEEGKKMKQQLKYLKTLSDQYPSIAEASTEIINLSSILNLPKGTEHFVSDIHGEYGQEPFEERSMMCMDVL